MYPVIIVKTIRMGTGTMLGPVWGWEHLRALFRGMGPHIFLVQSITINRMGPTGQNKGLKQIFLAYKEIQGRESSSRHMW